MRSKIVSLRDEGLTYSQIASLCGVTRGFVAGHLYRERNGIQGRAVLSISDDVIRAAIEAADNNCAEAARRLDMPVSTVKSRLSVKRRTGGQYKANRAWDLSTRHVCDMVERSGIPQQDVADRAGISSRTMSAWRAGVRPGVPQFLEWVREAIS